MIINVYAHRGGPVSGNGRSREWSQTVGCLLFGWSLGLQPRPQVEKERGKGRQRKRQKQQSPIEFAPFGTQLQHVLEVRIVQDLFRVGFRIYSGLGQDVPSLRQSSHSHEKV